MSLRDRMRRCALVVGQLSLGQRRSISPPQDRHRTFPRATVSGGPPRCPRRQVSLKWRRRHRWGRGSRCCRARGFQTSMSWWTLASPPRPSFVGSVRVAGCRGRNCGRTNGASQPQLGKRRVAGRRKSHTHKICVYLVTPRGASDGPHISASHVVITVNRSSSAT